MAQILWTFRSDSRTSEVRKINRLPLRLFVFLLSAFLSQQIIVRGPEVLYTVQAFIYPPIPHILPRWLSISYYVYFCIFVIGMLFPFLLFIGFVALAPRPKGAQGKAPFVSIVIPAFNEERCINRSLRASLSLDYPSYEVIIVDDGSTDLTLPLIENTSVSCIRMRKNQGKASALNAGITHAKGDIIVFSDSDSWLDTAAVRYLVRHFEDPRVGAVAGTVVIDKPDSYLRTCQTLEYLVGQAVVKTAQMGSDDCVSICPGPIGAYRKELLISSGGFKKRTLAEDFDTTLEVIAQGFRVSYEPRAVAYTESPDTWKGLWGQRLRWFRGNLQVIVKNRKILFSRTGGLVGSFWLPFYYLILGYGGVLAEIAALFLIPFAILEYGSFTEVLKVASVYFVLVNSIVLIQVLFALVRSNRLEFRLMFAGFLMFPYNVFLNCIRFTAIIQEATGKESKWFK